MWMGKERLIKVPAYLFMDTSNDKQRRMNLLHVSRKKKPFSASSINFFIKYSGGILAYYFIKKQNVHLTKHIAANKHTPAKILHKLFIDTSKFYWPDLALNETIPFTWFEAMLDKECSLFSSEASLLRLQQEHMEIWDKSLKRNCYYSDRLNIEYLVVLAQKESMLSNHSQHTCKPHLIASEVLCYKRKQEFIQWFKEKYEIGEDLNIDWMCSALNIQNEPQVARMQVIE